MSAALKPLLALRRNRESQAQTRMGAAANALRAAEDGLARLGRDSVALDADVAATIDALYRQSVGARLSRGELDMLAARVEGQYQRQAAMRERIAAARQTVEERDLAAAEARTALAAARRDTMKLQQMVETMEREAAARAEAQAEDEATSLPRPAQIRSRQGENQP